MSMFNNLNLTKEWNTKQEMPPHEISKNTELIDTERKDNATISEHITTSSKYLDELLGGGVPVGKLTEVCANSGCGKSKLCIQLAINVQSPGLDGECIFIDTEGSFHTMKTSDKIHLFRVLSHAELLALIHQLPDILRVYTKVKLIIIDSIAYHFRLNTLDYGKRPLLLKWIAQRLDAIAQAQGIAVVMTNHVTRESEDGPWIPSLGPLWGRSFINRVFLYRLQGGLFGYLYKSQYEKDVKKTVQFCITDSGISDPGYEQLVDLNEKHDIDRMMKEAWEDIIKEKDGEQEQNPELDSIWEEEHIADEILYEIPSQVMVYDFNEEDDDTVDSTTSVNTKTNNNNNNNNGDDDDDDDDEIPNCIPPLSLLSSSPPATMDENTLLTLFYDDDDDDITFIEEGDTCSHFEDQILIKRKRSEDYFTTCNNKTGYELQ